MTGGTLEKILRSLEMTGGTLEKNLRSAQDDRAPHGTRESIGNQRSGQGPLAYYVDYLEKTTFTSE